MRWPPILLWFCDRLRQKRFELLWPAFFWKYPFQLQFKAIVGVRCVNFIIHQKKYTRFLYFHLPKSLLNRYPSLISYISGLCSCYTKYDIQFAHYSGIKDIEYSLDLLRQTSFISYIPWKRVPYIFCYWRLHSIFCNDYIITFVTSFCLINKCNEGRIISDFIFFLHSPHKGISAHKSIGMFYYTIPLNKYVYRLILSLIFKRCTNIIHISIV